MRPIPLAVLPLIHEFEGDHGTFEATRTLDPAGNPEIGYGHKLAGPDDPLWNATLDQDSADGIAMKDMAIAAAGVCAALGNVVDQLSDNQYAALIDFTFNAGVGAFTHSTLCAMVKAHNFTDAANQFSRWIYAAGKPLPGLIRRRAAEHALFIT